MDYTDFLNKPFGDHFSSENEEEIMVVSMNINSLKIKSWKAKNDMLRDFLLQLQADIIALQETNMNWTKIPWQDR